MPLDAAAPRPVMPRFAATLDNVAEPPILACRNWAADYDTARHGPLLDLTQAVPGWPPPAEFRERLAAAAGDPRYASYGKLEGEDALRDAVALETNRVYGGDVGAADVRITAGANVGFQLAATVMTAPGERLMLPAPWFFNHQMALALRGVGTLALPCEAANGFLPDPGRAAALLTPDVRAIVLVTPNNPTGAVMPATLIERFAELCRSRGLWLVLDETYRDFIATPSSPHALFARPDWREFVVQLYSFSKAYCIPGHRMGAVVAGPAFRVELLKAIDNLQICAPRPPQAALAWAIPSLQAWRDGNRARIAARAAAFAGTIEGVPGWRVAAIGAYFAWVRVPDGGPGSRAVARALASAFGVVTLPGDVFGPGYERYVRMAFANLDEEAGAGLAERLAAATACR